MTILFMLITLLLATVIVVAIGDKTGLPWPALMTIVAAGGALLPFLPEFTIPADLMLPIFIPPLLWALARKSSWAVIRSQMSTIITMSVLLVFVTIAALTGASMLLLPGIGLAGAIMLAAAIAPPDPVAVDAVAEPAGIPKRITTTLQTEGLFNDAASIVAFHVALAALVAGEDLSWSTGVLEFLWSCLAAVILGLVIGRAAAWFTDHVSSVEARNAFTWVLPFAIYVVAEEIGGSGVIAIVIAAVEMNSRASIGAEDRLTGSAFWGTIEVLFTGVAFGLIGLNVRAAIDEVGSELWHAVVVGIVLSVVAIVVRGVWMFAAYKRNRFKIDKKGATNSSLRAPLRLQESLLMTWAGMRGLVTLALVLSIPEDIFPYHHELQVIALVVLLITMVGPGLTLPWLMRKLSLDKGPDAAGDESIAALTERAHKAATTYLVDTTELPMEQMVAIKNWFSQEIDADELQENVDKLHQRAHHARVGAIKAAQEELLKARRERGVNPAYVDEVLTNIDRMLVAAER
ncbi:putative secondary Na+/H+ antiporter, monovalent cation:proton antiporter-1 (CPA1) family [Corynebacterium glutamicum MB001]|uniref:NhaP-type Na+/H+ and K+/H+ antiporters n=1 Tax=Corynebacterium glutamicum (strain ATCC 13032 / DSM 20300 / JCM 1318 / BCRC 11384 / CCUG 27702 / LMG 3730 / NBRC 12168 / NCIMB 10025 / NRRL B-2784 / 534) TaxID=196627 RepID=Q8NQJ9_CORGL|nr:sodium:proton antiporter [Corynebacterium glutamicum]AGT05402.1 putative secondary Na+/H+ antiporter, monovalent cation:proton antiporter-1 (CPA1) family [Corynebacterium glutamicum MB001]ARV64422.1 sodium:proton antiporter [Corynebacterium glutamicum]ASW14052.1 putative secondary Na+/H+ antiporter, monovalent cation:proton antiporter-1 (CPA1) family [Corynebacterium glutamicum]AUI00957.1 sodium:proton antiporter [Corynebacterium glutamicum]AUI04600.1 sodium:proton antiporter [Corynebacteri